jgi:hypothetical protein
LSGNALFDLFLSFFFAGEEISGLFFRREGQFLGFFSAGAGQFRSFFSAVRVWRRRDDAFLSFFSAVRVRPRLGCAIIFSYCRI